MLTYTELIKLSIEELDKELNKAKSNDDNAYWKFSRQTKVDTSEMSETTIYLKMVRLVKRYYSYIDKPIQLYNNGLCLFSHKLNTFEKIQTCDRIRYKNPNSTIKILE